MVSKSSVLFVKCRNKTIMFKKVKVVRFSHLDAVEVAVEGHLIVLTIACGNNQSRVQ